VEPRKVLSTMLPSRLAVCLAKAKRCWLVSCHITIASIITYDRNNGSTGMPGAFTPTCTGQHLPGYVKNAGQLNKVGIDTIGVITTNDRYVNEQWGSQLGALASSDLLVLSDGDGDFVKSLGLADDMGFGVGVRSKRFVLVLQDGKVENIVVDEGLNDCSVTSAEAILKLLTPPAVVQEDSSEGAAFTVLAGVAVAVAAAVFASGNIMPSRDTPSPMNLSFQFKP
jgi:glutaredoxin/glutathione-dependent peroxiredoxin